MAGPRETVDLSNLPHPLDPEASKDARNESALYHDIAAFGSVAPPGEPRAAPVRCVKRTERARCDGFLAVRRRDVPPAVDWQCAKCKWAGTVFGWKGTDADLRDMASDLVAREELAHGIDFETAADLRDAARRAPELRRLAYSAFVDAGHDVFLSFDRARLQEEFLLLDHASESAKSKAVHRRLSRVIDRMTAES